MKLNIVQSINHMLLSIDQSSLYFGHSVISNLIEHINLFGMSVSKFRRMLKLLIGNFTFQSNFKSSKIEQAIDCPNLEKIIVH